MEFDGYSYETIEVNGECWFAENLRTTVYSNGDAIPELVSNSDWAATTEGARSYYNNDGPMEAPLADYNYSAYGALYNFYAVSDARGLCPTGFRVASDGDWTSLENSLGGDPGLKLKASPQDTLPWVGTNTIGFTGQPGGQRGTDGTFLEGGFSGNTALFWTSTPNGGDAWLRHMPGGNNGIGRYGDGPPRKGFSVRCVGAKPQALAITTMSPSGVTDTTAQLNGSINSNGYLFPVISNAGYAFGLDRLNLDGSIDGAGICSSDGVFCPGEIGVTDGWETGNEVHFCAWAEYQIDGNTTRIYGDTLSFLQMPNPCEGLGATLNYSGHDYDLVAIGTQCWFAENLRNENYANGDAIPGDLSDAAWSSTNSGAQVISYDDATRLETYGRLYNWYAVSDPRGLCPSGWHVPTDDEFTELTTTLGGAHLAGNAMKASETDSPAWNGSNSSGFSALEGGRASDNGGVFSTNMAWFWSSSLWIIPSEAWFRRIGPNNDDIVKLSTEFRNGYSVRCLRD